MGGIVPSLLLAFGQLADARILRILLKSLGLTLLLFVLVGWAGWWALDWALARAGLANTLFGGAEEMRGFASLLLTVAGLWLVWRIIAMAVIQFFADDVVQAVERRHYPTAARSAKELRWREQFVLGFSAAARALLFNLVALPVALALLVTGIGTALLFWLVNAVLLGRELQDMVWLRHRNNAAESAPLGKVERFLLGAVIAGLMMLPLVNFLAPIIGAAAATHLFHRKKANHAH